RGSQGLGGPRLDPGRPGGRPRRERGRAGEAAPARLPRLGGRGGGLRRRGRPGVEDPRAAPGGPDPRGGLPAADDGVVGVRRALVLARRELQASFDSPIAYIFLVVFLVLS